MFLASIAMRATGVSLHPFMRQGCPQNINSSMWGIWIDGRDSGGGSSAYGEAYGQKVMPALQMVYDTPFENELKVAVFMKIKEHLGVPWRGYDNPVHYEVGPCHESALPKTRVKEIMSTVSVVNAEYLPFQGESEDGYANAIQKLFAIYSNAISSRPPVGEALNHMGVLIQNLAYLHPLSDANGRSRLLLLQYLLRQQGISCGTMMYNNNKNVYFDTVLDIVGKIHEGISMYNDAFSSGFSVNPWATPEAVDKVTSHCSTYAHPWDDDLVQCWQTMINGGNAGTSPMRSSQCM